MTFQATVGDASVEFVCEGSIAARWVNQSILEGRTYPYLPFLGHVEVIVDVGANCGAATVFFAHHHPRAVIHAVEPGSRQRAMLRQNVAALPDVRVHPIGLHAVNGTAELYQGRDTTGSSSIVRAEWHGDDHETIELRAADDWLRSEGIERIDVLKLDAEGCEVPILERMEPWMPTVQALYVEYDSRVDRRRVDELLASTHELLLGKVLLDQGECLYVHRDLADRGATSDWLSGVVRSAARQGRAS